MASFSLLKLLLVDDDHTALLLLRAVFESDRRLEVLTAVTGEDAMRIAAEIGPALVLLHISVPDREGYAVYRFIKYHSNYGRAKVVFLSGLSDRSEWNTRQSVGADGSHWPLTF